MKRTYRRGRSWSVFSVNRNLLSTSTISKRTKRWQGSTIPNYYANIIKKAPPQWQRADSHLHHRHGRIGRVGLRTTVPLIHHIWPHATFFEWNWKSRSLGRNFRQSTQSVSPAYQARKGLSFKLIVIKKKNFFLDYIVIGSALFMQAYIFPHKKINRPC